MIHLESGKHFNIEVEVWEAASGTKILEVQTHEGLSSLKSLPEGSAILSCWTLLAASDSEKIDRTPSQAVLGP